MSQIPSQPANSLESRRLRAWALHQQGWTGHAIAKALGVTPGAVSQWLSRAREEGPEALRTCPHPGPTRRLTLEKQAALPQLLARGPGAFGLAGERWTDTRFQAALEREFGVRYHRSYVYKMLRSLGWKYQRAAQRATERVDGPAAR